jgi:hypothetical protein
MIDPVTHERITIVTTEGLGHPYFIVTEDKLDAVKAAFRENGVTYWIGDYFIEIDDEPPVIYITLARGADIPRIQQILDNL